MKKTFNLTEHNKSVNEQYMTLHVKEPLFRKTLREELSSSSPISHPEYLSGREKNLTKIDRAFNSIGRHIFIYGDRGVGKTSLAQSAARIHQSSDAEPIIIACDHTSSFFDIVRNIVQKCLPPGDVIQNKEQTVKAGFSFRVLNAEVEEGIKKGFVPTLKTVNEAVDVAKYVCAFHSSAPVIVIDEFDQIENLSDRKFFADFIKQISDQKIPLKLIFCGIGGTVEKLLGAHLSTDRYLSPIELEPLSHDARWEIVTRVFEKLHLKIDRNYYIRIGQISDGYPHYIHLLTEQILYAMFDDKNLAYHCRSDHFNQGIMEGVKEAHNTLQQVYKKATEKYNDDYHEVLWTVADQEHFRSRSRELYDNSYLKIMRKRENRETLSYARFQARLTSLKSDRHGAILTGHGAGWYSFTENIVRGYTRLMAEKNGIGLGNDHL